MDEPRNDYPRITREQLSALKDAFYGCDNWRVEDLDEAFLTGDCKGFRMWVGEEDGRYAGGFMNDELGIQGILPEHVVHKLYDFVKNKVKNTKKDN